MGRVKHLCRFPGRTFSREPRRSMSNFALWTQAASVLLSLAAALVVADHTGWALVTLLGGRGSDRARAIIADGVLAALAFSMAGTLLAALALDGWRSIGMFCFVFALRTLLKRVFAFERNSAEMRLVRRSDARQIL